MDNDTPNQPAQPTELERELSRWYGNLLAQLGPRVSTDVFRTLDDNRLALNRILDAARAATP